KVSKGTKPRFDTFDTSLSLEYEKKSETVEKQPERALRKGAVQFLKEDCPELQSVATLLRCPECGARLHQLTHPEDETDHYTACEACAYRAITPTVLRGFCYGDDCGEDLTYINDQAWCKRHQMTITIIGREQ